MNKARYNFDAMDDEELIMRVATALNTNELVYELCFRFLDRCDDMPEFNKRRTSQVVKDSRQYEAD